MSKKRLDASGAAPSRRAFLKDSSLLMAAGATVASQALPVQRAAFAGGSDEIKIGLIGCGGRGTGAAIQALDTEGPVKLTAMTDVFQNRLQASYRAIKGKHNDRVDVPEERRFVGIEGYKQVIDSGVDMVLLCTPPGFRPMHFEAAVNAGKHVFMEKPVATDAPGVRRVLAANKIAKEKNLAVAGGLQRHHESGYKETIKKLQEGAIGDIILARAYWNGGGVWIRNRDEKQSETEYQMNNWYYFNWLSGDHIVEQYIHNLDVINWLMQSYPVEAQGQGGRQVRTGPDTGEIFDHHFVEFTYPNGTKLLSQCRHIEGCWSSVEEFAHGSNGWADISGGKIYDKSGKLAWQAPKNEDGWAQEHHDLFAAIRRGERPNEGDYGAYSTLTSIMGRLATYSGAKLTWDECLNSQVALADFDSIKSFDAPAPIQPVSPGKYQIAVPGTNKKNFV
ncbi:MAG: Gfo/Idh/MocA family protein [Pirellulaceae bacterium]